MQLLLQGIKITFFKRIHVGVLHLRCFPITVFLLNTLEQSRTGATGLWDEMIYAIYHLIDRKFKGFQSLFL